ncbi:hypothetical protein FRACYDRAFT_238364 [Fragilariopsis cylindrus CCMP1102]|uniref:POZ domain-containing protein n=1 Tax=Fragilariopsis cylindrus CCMP1102 TaxID=635003 RepID=A0A1E7FII2_9STRA|nr:hypothetical protein FRACYDRAFT_238364 [Fragilariopsis cylindrus CCMP1102]|eukprot:OEU17934.1 hypothetical protein FRACYDRAFT_238364 [Fragilariopsis cylindrus CCMP1102]
MSSNLSEKCNRIGVVSVGPTPKLLKHEIQTMEFRINDFANHNQVRGKPIKTPSIRAYGHDWILRVFPRGSPSSREDFEYVSCFLLYVGDNDVDDEPSTMLSFRCKDTKRATDELHVFCKDCNNGDKRLWGYQNFLKRTDVLENYLDKDGTLVIEVDIQIAEERKNIWYPDPLQEEPSLVKLYHTHESTSDITFDVDGKEFHAHKSILSVRAETLFELTNDDDNGRSRDGKIVTIISTEADIFEQILEYVYTVKTPEIKNEGIAIELLVAADRFGCTDLKLYIESTIVDKFLNATNAAKWLLLSDSYSCALLKEASMRLHVSDANTVMESKDDWSMVVESNRLLEELFKSNSSNSSSNSSSSSSNSNAVVDIENLDVTTLRETLVYANLEIDGCRNILIERLKRYQLENDVLQESSSSLGSK